jgi:phosphate-selective porin OprO/OprP
LTALEKQHQQEVNTLVSRIHELEQKVASNETARVLPTVVLPAQSGPSTEELDQKIRILQRQNELAAESAAAQAASQPRLTVGSNGASFSSADSNFVFRLRGVLQLDTRLFFDDNQYNQGNTTFLLRRARPIFEGTVFRDADFQFVPDFGGSSVQIFDANMTYRFMPELQLRAGKYKSPVGLEQLQADANLLFNERALPTALVPNRNIGVELRGEALNSAIGYSAGIFNNTGDGRNPNNSDFNDGKEYAGRVFGQPFKNTDWGWLQGWGLGVGGSYADISSNNAALPATTGGTLPGYWSAGQQQWFAYNPAVGSVVADGPHWRISPQTYYLHGPFGLMGEYAISDQGVLNTKTLARADLDNRAWEVSGQWVLTGEDASFAGINPKQPFDLHDHGWGAWQLVARYGHLKIDDAAFPNFSNPATSANEATEWAVGLNWWLNRNVRLMTSFSHTTFQGGGKVLASDASTTVPPATVSHQDENVFFTRLQLAF